jgi:DNA-binding MarR family transcriptional regulator
MSKRTKDELLQGLNDLVRRQQVSQDVFDDAVSDWLGVNRTDLRVMDIVQREGAVPIGEVARQAALSPAAMTTSIDRLEQKGYVRREPDPSDRRRVLVEITPLAEERAWQIYGPIQDGAYEQWGSMSVAELEFLEQFLSSAIEFSAEYLERVRSLPRPD